MNKPAPENILQLTPNQSGVLYHCLVTGDPQAYLHQHVYLIEGALDVTAFQSAWAYVLRRHPTLRTSFHWEGLRHPVQVVHRDLEVPLVIEEAGSVEPEGRALEALLEETRANGLPLDKAPLMRLRLLRAGAAKWLLLWDFHYLLLDGWSERNVLGELFTAYASLVASEEPRLPPAPPYADFVRYLRKRDTEQRRAFWSERVGGLVPGKLNTAHRPWEEEVAERGSRAVARELAPADAAAMVALAEEERVPLNAVYLAGWAQVVSAQAGGGPAVFGLTMAGRPPELDGFERMVGLFVNTLPVQVDVPAASTFRELVRLSSAASSALLAHQDTPLWQVKRWGGQGAGEELFDNTHVFQNVPEVSATGSLNDDAALRLTPLRMEESSNFSVNAIALPGPKPIIRLVYDQQGAGEWWASSLLERWSLALQAAKAPDEPLSHRPLLPPGERAQVLQQWNDTAAPYERDATLVDLVERQVGRSPDALAVLGEHAGLTYRELDDTANRIAHALAAEGVGSGDFVGVLMDRTPRMVATLLGILKRGAAYVPLEPWFPLPRVRLVLETVAARALVVDDASEDLAALVEAAPVVFYAGEARLAPAEMVRLDDAALARFPSERSAVPISPEQLAYVIFTSGSTGKPKGVMVQHRPVVNLIEWVNQTHDVNESDRLLFVTSVCFDLSVYDMFGILAAGGSVRIASRDELADPDRLTSLLSDGSITFWDSAPAAMRRLLPLLGGLKGRGGCDSLRLAFFSGDWVPVAMPDALKEVFPRLQVVALGGATEATVWSNSCPVDEVSPRWTSIPYGRPMQNARYYVLDRAMQPCPVGVVGDLYIGGECLALGYSAAPRLTAERFVPDPHGEEGGRLYVTGDKARFWPDGTIEFHGREDNQVKIRGYRIELGEIETVLARHPSVKDAVVDAFGSREDRFLVAYYVAEGAPSEEELRAHLLGQLPEYMVPSVFLALDSIPVTANGKVDRRALPAPDRVASRRQYLAPRDDMEERLARIWAEILSLPEVGVTESFFDLGGHSLLAVPLVSRVREETGRAVPISILLEAPTIERMAAELRREGARGELVPISTTGAKPPLFCVHPSGGEVMVYAGLGEALAGERPVLGVQSRVWGSDEEELPSIEAMAEHYAALIRRRQPEGPYSLFGWSMGGILAVEIARLFEHDGEEVRFLGLCDSHLTTKNEETTRGQPLGPLAMAFGGALDAALSQVDPEELLRLERELKQRHGREQLELAYRWGRERGLLAAGLPLDAIERSVELSLLHDRLLDRHESSRVRCSLHVWWAREGLINGAPSTDWSLHSSGEHLVTIAEGNHYTMVRPPRAEALWRSVADAVTRGRAP